MSLRRKRGRPGSATPGWSRSPSPGRRRTTSRPSSSTKSRATRSRSKPPGSAGLRPVRLPTAAPATKPNPSSPFLRRRRLPNRRLFRFARFAPPGGSFLRPVHRKQVNHGSPGCTRIKANPVCHSDGCGRKKAQKAQSNPTATASSFFALFVPLRGHFLSLLWLSSPAENQPRIARTGTDGGGIHR